MPSPSIRLTSDFAHRNRDWWSTTPSLFENLTGIDLRKAQIAPLPAMVQF
jgi:hypothetical protein